MKTTIEEIKEALREGKIGTPWNAKVSMLVAFTEELLKRIDENYNGKMPPRLGTDPVPGEPSAEKGL